MCNCNCGCGNIIGQDGKKFEDLILSVKAHPYCDRCKTCLTREINAISVRCKKSPNQSRFILLLIRWIGKYAFTIIESSHEKVNKVQIYFDQAKPNSKRAKHHNRFIEKRIYAGIRRITKETKSIKRE